MDEKKKKPKKHEPIPERIPDPEWGSDRRPMTIRVRDSLRSEKLTVEKKEKIEKHEES